LLTVDSPIDHFTAIFAKKDRNFDIKSDQDIKGLRIAYFKQIIYLDQYFESKKNAVTLIKTASPLDAFKAVLDGKADVMVGLNIDRYLLTQNSILEIEPIYAFKNLKPQSVLGVRADYPILATLFEKAINTITLEEREKILSKWTWIPKNKTNIIEFTSEEKEYLKQHSTLTVQNLMTFPPFNFNENGIAKGYTVDYMMLMAKYIGIDIEFVSGKPWHEYLQMIKNKTLDVIPHIAITDERKKFIDFTDFNHIEYTTGMVIKKDSNIHSMADLKDKVVAVAKKTFLHTHLKNNFPHISLLLTTSSSEAVEAVSIGRADAVLGSLPSLYYFIQKNWLSNVQTVKIDDLELAEKTKMPMGVAKGNVLLKSILSKANNAIPHNEVVELKQKWMNIKTRVNNKFVLNTKERKYLEKKQEISMCIDPDWMPFEKNENGKHIGMSAEYIEILKKSLDTKITMVNTKTWPNYTGG